MKMKSLLAAAALGLAATAASATTLNNVSGSIDWKVSGYSTESANKFGSNESTFVVGAVNSLKQGANNVWAQGEAGEYLYYIIYGIADLSTSTGGLYGNNIFGTGATGGDADGKIHIDIYKHTGLALSTFSLGDRTAFDQFTGITDVGTLFLSLELVAGGIQDDLTTPENEATDATLFQNATGLTLPAIGQGFFYAEATGGSNKDQWNTNGFLGGAADMRGAFTLTPSGIEEFPGEINDPIKSTAIPEPGSLALLGLGLAGLGALRRRKAA